MATLDYNRMLKQMPYFNKSSEEIFVWSYNQVDKAMTYPETTEGCLAELLKKRHALLMEVNNFIDDPEMEEEYPMDHEDEEGWRIAKEITEKYSIVNFFMNKLVDYINKNQVEPAKVQCPPRGKMIQW